MPQANATTREYWQQVMDDWKASEITISQYAQLHNLKPHQLYYWKKQLLSQPDVAPELIPIGTLPPSSENVTLWLSDQYRLEIPVSSASRRVPELLRTLRFEP